MALHDIGWKIVAVLALFVVVFLMRRGSASDIDVAARIRERRRARRTKGRS